MSSRSSEGSTHEPRGSRVVRFFDTIDLPILLEIIVDTEINRSKKSDALQVIVTGNPIDGFCFHGPFLQSNQEERDVYVDQFLKGEEWWGAPLVNLANANIEDHV